MVFYKRRTRASAPQNIPSGKNNSLFATKELSFAGESKSKSNGFKSFVDFMTIQKQISIRDIRRKQPPKTRDQPTNSLGYREDENICLYLLHSILNSDKIFIRCLTLIITLFLILYILINKLIPLFEKLLDSLVVIGRWYSVGNISHAIFNGSIWRDIWR